MSCKQSIAVVILVHTLLQQRDTTALVLDEKLLHFPLVAFSLGRDFQLSSALPSTVIACLGSICL